MDLRRRALGRSVALVGAIGVLAGAPGAGAQETIPDEKPDLDLPRVVIEGIDESLLGVGEVADDSRQPDARGLPLTIPDAGKPVDIQLTDRAERVSFDDIDRPELPSLLTVRGFAYGGAFQTVRAGFDLKHELPAGGLFGSLDGTASDGHLDEAPWTRIGVTAGAAFEPSMGGVFRVEVSRRSREQDLPVTGLITDDLVALGRTQSYQRWGADVRYRVEGGSGFVAGLFAKGSRSGFRPDDLANKQSFTSGEGGLNLSIPLSGQVWSISLDATGGALREEAPDGTRDTRAILEGRLTTRIANVAGWGVVAGAAYHQLGKDDVVGPVVRIVYSEPPVVRYWAGVRPYFERPDLDRHLERTWVASGRTGQNPEFASISGEAGVEVRPIDAVEVRVESNVRRSRGLLHLNREEDGRYSLRNLDRRLVVDTDASMRWALGGGVEASAAYRLRILEGTDAPYVSPHQGSAGLSFQLRSIELSAGASYVGERPGTGNEGDLESAWLVGAGASMEVASRWRIGARGENLTDQKYREYGEYEARGRYVEAGIRYAF